MHMTNITSFHGGKLKLSTKDRGVSWDNSNAIALIVAADPGSHESNPYGAHWAEHELNFFGLDAATAEALYLLGALSPEKREAILPAMRHALDEQRAEAEE